MRRFLLPYIILIASLPIDVFSQLVIIDTAGRDALNKELTTEIKEVNKAVKPDEALLVISGDIGQGAQTQAEAFHKNVGVTGVIVTKLDGTAFLKKLQESPELPKVPILVSSNLSSVKKISDVMTMGAVGYVIKSDESLQSIVQDIERVLGEDIKK